MEKRTRRRLDRLAYMATGYVDFEKETSMFLMHGFDKIQVSKSIMIFKICQTSLEGIQDPQALWLGEEGALPRCNAVTTDHIDMSIMGVIGLHGVQLIELAESMIS